MNYLLEPSHVKKSLQKITKEGFLLSLAEMKGIIILWKGISHTLMVKSERIQT